jgi:hypothetical protein
MKMRIVIAIGAALGVAIYQGMKNDVPQIDWWRVAAVPVIVFVLLLFVPNRWLERTKTPGH